MLLRPANFLLLDEPTNHLDLRAKDVLLEALEKFAGTVVFVSHDRYFIDKLATRVFHIEGGTLQDYPGNYEDYLWQKERSMAQPVDSNGSGNLHSVESADKSVRERWAKKINPSSIRKMEKERDDLVEQISRCEADISSLELESAHFKSAQESIRLAGLLDGHRARLKNMTERWEQLVMALESASSAEEPSTTSTNAD